MRTLLLILGYLITDSALSDPCEDPTVLEDTWRSTDCIKTECVIHEKWKCDKDLVQGWYRFKSSGAWEIPETEDPKHHCSTKHPGWLKGSHPTVEQGEVTRTVCFTKDENQCDKTLEIKIKNCTSSFVYELKPAPGSESAYCTNAGSALTDPCVNHTVLDQPWRSTECIESQCVGHEKWKCDEELVHGWYRFKSSGGWEIPENEVPEKHCSTKHPGWLKGSHPTVGQGEVKRTVCFTEKGNTCDKNLEIKIKNCTSYFVYELKPTPDSDMAYCTDTDSAHTDPCEHHTVLADTWRSTDCFKTECVGHDNEKCDKDLGHGWYRFKSSGGWEIPETEVPKYRCSTKHPGWLNGSHPTVGQGEVERTVCFTEKQNICNKTLEIKIKNCTSYFVYELKPTLEIDMAYCTVTDSALTDPCEDHTVLVDTWRSTDCNRTECAGHENSKYDKDLVHGWYRFKSSGGWEIPETQVPDYRCSRKHPGRLTGSHPTVGQGEVMRTVCFSWEENPCHGTLQIKIKNCISYFVYELKPTPGINSAYCTDPKTVPNQEPEEHSTRESADRRSSIPLVSTASDPETSPTEEPEEQSTRKSADRTYTTPAGSADSDPETFSTHELEEQSTGKSAERSSSVSAGSATSDPETSPIPEEEQTNRESVDRSSTIPVVSAASDPETSPTQDPEEQSTRESAESTSTTPAGSAASDPETSPTHEHEEQSTRQSAERSSSLPAGSATADPETSPAQHHEEQSKSESIERSFTIPAGSTASEIETPLTQEPKEQSTRESPDRTSTITVGSASSDPETPLTQEPEEQSTLVSADRTSSITAGSADSDPENSPTQKPEEQSTRKSADRTSTNPAGSAASDPETSPTHELEEQSTREFAEGSSSVTAESETADPETSPTQEVDEQTNRESVDRSPTIPAMSAASDAELSPTHRNEEHSTRESTDRTSTIPARSATSDPEAILTQEPEDQTSQESNEKSSTIAAGSTASDSGKKTSSGAKGESNSEAECKPSEEGHSRPVGPSLSDEECEKGRDEVQVINVGQTNLDTHAKKDAFLRQVQEMLKDHLPCKRFVLKSEDEKN